jgi:hypothetical protein
MVCLIKEQVHYCDIHEHQERIPDPRLSLQVESLPEFIYKNNR